MFLLLHLFKPHLWRTAPQWVAVRSVAPAHRGAVWLTVASDEPVKAYCVARPDAEKGEPHVHPLGLLQEEVGVSRLKVGLVASHL